MTVAEKLEEQEANPYNMKKDWHKGETPRMESADGLFFAPEPSKATSSEEAEAPEKEEKSVLYLIIVPNLVGLLAFIIAGLCFKACCTCSHDEY